MRRKRHRLTDSHAQTGRRTGLQTDIGRQTEMRFAGRHTDEEVQTADRQTQTDEAIDIQQGRLTDRQTTR